MNLKSRMEVVSVKLTKTHEFVVLKAIGPPFGYAEDGHDLDNNYSIRTPKATLTLKIERPGMMGQYKPGMIIRFNGFETKEKL